MEGYNLNPFSMNTIAFAEEVAVDEAEAVLETADVVAEDAAVAEADAELSDCVHYDDKGEPTTYVEYAKDSTDKKATIGTIATIHNTDNPVSWNNYYADDFLYTVLYGDDNETGSLNNSKPLTVSKANAVYAGDNIKGLRTPNNNNIKYDVVTVKDGEAYLLVGYSLDGGYLYEDVAGHDDRLDEYGTGNWDCIPTIEYDGRAIDFNKSGIHKYATNKKEALDVKVALVKYENGKVTELPGVSVTAKVDKKTANGASVAAATTEKEVKYKVGDQEYTTTLDEHATLGDLPSFTIAVKAKGNDAKPYAKDIKEKLKDKKFYFGVIQGLVQVYDLTSEYSNYLRDKREGTPLTGYTYPKTISSNEEIKEIEEEIAKNMNTTNNLNFDDEEWDAGVLTLTKFNGTKGTLTRDFEDLGDDKKGHNKEGKVTLKQGTDYDFSDRTLAGEKVQVLEFKGNNWVYDPGIYDDNLYYSLAGFGYKWAFRMTPVDKAKTFRRGIYKDTDNGFVYSTED